jgi:DNA-directed RNA polymerase subunit M/transcription elongation factor TFIIS
MALPVFNDLPKYDLTIPSTKEKVRFRPFLVKEQKVLLMAMESQDQTKILDSITDTLAACFTEVKISNLTTFDVEYMFTQLRGKSVGESSTISVFCQSCEESNEYNINLDEIVIDVPVLDNKIVLNDQYTLQMRFPKYTHMLKNEALLKSDSGVEQVYEMVLGCMDCLLTEEERILFDDESKEDTTRFLESLTADQFTKIMDFVNAIPKLQKDIEFDCTKCGHHNKLVVQGIGDFF